MSNIPPGLETLEFSFEGRHDAGPFSPVLVGVVGSGNLEVLLEPHEGAQWQVSVDTSARGFGAIWQAVLQDAHERHPWAGMRISIHDMGATPAVVSLRLDQAFQTLLAQGASTKGQP